MKYLSLFITQILFLAPAVMAMASAPNPDPNAPAPPGWVQIVPIAVMFLIIYVLMIRPQVKQRKEHQSMVNALKKGDRIITRGGLIGTIANIHPGIIEVKLNDDVKVKLQQDAVTDLYVEKAQKPEIVGTAKK